MGSQATHPGIVVGVDGSEEARTAVQWAAQAAMMRNSALTLVHVADTPAVVSPIVMFPAAPALAELRRWQEEKARRIFAEALETVGDASRGAEAPEVHRELFFSAPVPTLSRISQNAQLIVVGRRGQSRWQRVLLGSVSTGLVHHAHCPVAVIPDESPPAGSRAGLPVVVGIDGSPASESATAIAFEEAARRGVDLVALHAWSDAEVSDLPSLEWSTMQSAAEEVLAERMAGWQERYPDVRVDRLIVWERPARHLIEAADTAQLVVVGSHGRGGFAGLLLGSVGTAVVHGTRTPVIVARPA